MHTPGAEHMKDTDPDAMIFIKVYYYVCWIRAFLGGTNGTFGAWDFFNEIMDPRIFQGPQNLHGKGHPMSPHTCNKAEEFYVY